MRKQLLKAPLKFTRISSKFSRSRLHPVLKIRRPHLGVDYAAPSGTPVVAIADGVVTRKGWDSGGGGNTLRLRHANNLESAYLHLKGYAKGISVGTRVSQGQLIGYVGSTGMSTGPHLDFRLYKGGTAIDPLKAPSEPTEPVKQENMEWFNSVKDRVLAELQGEVAEGDKIMAEDLENFVIQTDTLTVETEVLAVEQTEEESVEAEKPKKERKRKKEKA
ncbi:MAG: M23 family metallopeptidase [Tidjanibacter sp.]|nr:M23 family metallopeptidase [Tidjanibacter sp.]